MTPNDRRAAEHDSARAIIAFFSMLDARDHERQWDQMTSDGVWNRAGAALDTRAKFLAAMAERPAHLTIRHMITNLLVTVTDDGNTASANFNLLVYVDMVDRGDKPAPLDKPSVIAAFHAQFRSENDAWRISQLDGETLFKS